MLNEQSETKLFSAYSATTTNWNTALIKSSRSPFDAAHRKEVYQKVFSRYDDMKNFIHQRTFSGTSEFPLLSNQYFNATMASYVRSFAGFFATERDMDQPTALLHYVDQVGVLDNRVIQPNIGPENLNDINSRWELAIYPTAGTTMYMSNTGKKLIPGSIKLKLYRKGKPNDFILITDNLKGQLLSPPGILVNNANGEANVNYNTGVVKFTLGDAWEILEGDVISCIGFEDVAGNSGFGSLLTEGKNRLKVEMGQIMVKADPDMISTEHNLMAIAQMQKSLGINPQDIAAAKLVELYTKLVNGKLVNAIKTMWSGDSVHINTKGFSERFHDFNSRLDAFQNALIRVDTAMARKSTKGTAATAYLVGENVGNWFKGLVHGGNWVDNNGSSYVNDLLGYYKGLPVVRHLDVDDNEGFAVHKTSDGQLAPVIRGIYLPLTNTPIVGNYYNNTQFSTGVYYQEANEPILPELLQRFTISDVAEDIYNPGAVVSNG